MDQADRNKRILRKYIPLQAVDIIANWIYTYDFKLKIKRPRSSKYGDYRQPYKGLNHQITINNNLNPYTFLITLVHELAHLTTYNKYRNKVKPHGKEWKMEYRRLMMPFMTKEIFPDDILNALQSSMTDPAASGSADVPLYKVLKCYDKETGMLHIEDLKPGVKFVLSDGRVFIRGKKIRTRYECKLEGTNQIYLFNALYEVQVYKFEEIESF